jgi:hypothetical protein
MKLPALWIAAAFAAGIESARHAHFSLVVSAGAAFGAILFATILLWRRQAAIAWALVLFAWATVGATGTTIRW